MSLRILYTISQTNLKGLKQQPHTKKLGSTIFNADIYTRRHPRYLCYLVSKIIIIVMAAKVKTRLRQRHRATKNP